MKFGEYYDKLKKMVKENPSILDLDVVYAKDEEGNGFDLIHCDPTLGDYSDDEGDFIPSDSFDDYEEEDLKVNAICLN